MNGLLKNILDNIESNAKNVIKENEGDYVVDGLLYCHKCNTGKQCKINFLGQERIVPCICRCEKEAYDREQEETRRIERDRRIARLRQTGFPESDMAQWNFAADDRANEKISNVAHNYVDHYEEMREAKKGLLFYGGVGTGKSFFAACIVNALIDKGYPCMMTNFARLVNTIQGKFEGKQEYIDGLNRFDLLVIDDLAAERDTDYMNEIVFNVIDSRYRAGLPTIITTNLTANEIKNPADIRKQRTYSRLLEMCLPVEVEGADRRREKLKDDFSRFNDLLGL